MNVEHLRTTLQFGVLALLIGSQLPFGSVQPMAVLSVELCAAVFALGAVLLVGCDEDSHKALPRLTIAACAVVVALGIYQVVPLPYALAEKFNPTVDLVRPIVPYLGLEHRPRVTWSVAAPDTIDAILRFIAYVLIGLTAAVAFNTEISRRRFAVVFVGGAVFQAVYGSGEYLTGRQHIFAFVKKYYLDSATGTLINRNHFATLLAMALPLALTLATSRERPDGIRGWRDRLTRMTGGRALIRFYAMTATALIWMGLLLSHSRAGLLAALLGIATLLIRLQAARTARWTFAIAGGVLFALLALELAQSPLERFAALKVDLETKGGRFTVWHDASALVVARPLLGWGFGTFESAFPMVQSANIQSLYDHAHNDWLEWTIEGGIVTLASALVILILNLRPTMLTGDGLIEGVLVGCQSAIVAVAVHGLWDFSLRIPTVAIASATLVGLTAASVEQSARLRRTSLETAPSRWGRSRAALSENG